MPLQVNLGDRHTLGSTFYFVLFLGNTEPSRRLHESHDICLGNICVFVVVSISLRQASIFHGQLILSRLNSVPVHEHAKIVVHSFM